MQLSSVAIGLCHGMLPVLEAVLYLLMRIQEQSDRDPVAGQLPAQIPCFLKPRVTCQPAIRHCYQQVKVLIGSCGAAGA